MPAEKTAWAYGVTPVGAVMLPKFVQPTVPTPVTLLPAPAFVAVVEIALVEPHTLEAVKEPVPFWQTVTPAVVGGVLIVTVAVLAHPRLFV